MKNLLKFPVMVFVLSSVFFLSCGNPDEVEGGDPEILNELLGVADVLPDAAKESEVPGEKLEVLVRNVASFRKAWPRFEAELPVLIRSVVARGSWGEKNRAIGVVDGVLNVRHRPEVVSEVGRLLDGLEVPMTRPLGIRIRLVEVGEKAGSAVFAGNRWDEEAFRTACRQGDARIVSGAVLRAANGEWVTGKQVTNQPYLTGIRFPAGTPVPATTAMASGLTVQTAAWRWGNDHAVVACSATCTGEAVGKRKLDQKIHRRLPSLKEGELRWEEHDVTIELPVREFIEYQGQVVVRKGEWTPAAIAPGGDSRLIGVLVRVDAEEPLPSFPSVDPLSEKGFLLEVIPVALPLDVRGPGGETRLFFHNRVDLGKNGVDWFNKRAEQVQKIQRDNVYNWQDGNSSFSNPQVGNIRHAVVAGARRHALAVLPERLRELRERVAELKWSSGTALEYFANHLFVVQNPHANALVRKLIEGVHQWRNDPKLFRIDHPVLADVPDTLVLAEKEREALRKGKSHLLPAVVRTRAGVGMEIFTGEMHSVLSGPWAENSTSPELQVFWKGRRLSLHPGLSTEGPGRVDVTWKAHSLEGLEPFRVAGALLQQPRDSVWTAASELRLSPGTGVILSVDGAPAPRAVVVSLEEKP